MGFGKSYSSGGDLVYYQPIKPTPISQTTSAEDAAENPIEEETWSTPITMESLVKQMVAQMAPHKRPISSKEYDKWLEIIKTGKGPDGKIYYEDETSALAIVVLKNFAQFFPDLTVDPAFEAEATKAYTLSTDFKDIFSKNLSAWNMVLSAKTPEETANLYTDLEKLDMKKQGIAFLDFDSQKPKQNSVPPKVQEIVRSAHFSHPLLRYLRR